MPLNHATVGTLFRTELRMLLRDRRTVITSILLPMLIMPVMLLATSGMKRLREKTLGGSFSADNAEAFINLLVTSREVRVERVSPTHVILHPVTSQ